jgi:hypothetical protein
LFVCFCFCPVQILYRNKSLDLKDAKKKKIFSQRSFQLFFLQLSGQEIYFYIIFGQDKNKNKQTNKQINKAPLKVKWSFPNGLKMI